MKRSGFLQRKTPIRRVSAKRAEQNRDYANIRADYLADNPVCQVCHAAESVDIHHSAQRHGALLTKKELFVASCRRCHDWIHRNGREARRLGFLV